MKSITIIGRKWFDKVNGNTYHTSQIMVDGVTVGKTEYAYGYGDHYIQSASEWLEKNGHISPEHYQWGGTTPLWTYCRDNDIHLETQCHNCLKREI